MNRADIWVAQVGRKSRPVLVLTRPEVIDVRQLVTVAEITTQMRGLAAEVELDHAAVGLEKASAVNCDGIHTIAQTLLTRHVGTVDDRTMARVCQAISYALGWDADRRGANSPRLAPSLPSPTPLRLDQCR